MGLFRVQALDHQRDKYLGEVIVFRSRINTFAVVCVVLCFFLGVIFLLVGSHNRKQTVAGYLTLDSGIVNIKSPFPGIVKNIFIKEGQLVQEGEPLFLLENVHGLPGSANSSDAMLDVYQQRLVDLDEQWKYLEKQELLQNSDLSDTINVTNKNILSSNENMELLKKRLSVSERKWESTKVLYERSLISRVAVEEFENDVLEIKFDINNLEKIIREQKNIVTQRKYDKENKSYIFKEKIKQIEEKKLEIEEKIIYVRSQTHYLIKAPLSGHVSFVNVKSGEHIGQDSISAILPSNSKVEAELLVPSAAIGFLELGQKVLIRYSSFPFQKFGLHGGNVSHVDKSILLPEDLGRAPIVVREAVYKVKVQLDKDTVTAYGKELPVRPGMTLSADIELEKRSIFEWLMEPVLSIKGRL
ncbi:MAG: HlyD family efflux transporter periplasmic adaptor subunit [Pseudomonadota bacterium]